MRALLASCLVFVAAWSWAARTLPERVPMHFGPSGEADRWGGRTELLVVLAVCGVVLAAVMGLGLIAVRRSRWRWVNVPHKEWWTATAARQDRLRSLLERDLGVVGASTMLVLAVLLVGTSAASRGPDPALPAWVLGLLALWLVAVLGWAVLAMTRTYRPDS